jgi:CheY-like chemotaxis protein
MSRVAVIDDDQALRDVLAEVLVEGGHQVSFAATGAEAVRWPE